MYVMNTFARSAKSILNFINFIIAYLNKIAREFVVTSCLFLLIDNLFNLIMRQYDLDRNDAIEERRDRFDNKFNDNRTQTIICL